jgi:hypothetical protein
MNVFWPQSDDVDISVTVSIIAVRLFQPVAAFGISYVEDEFIAVNKGTISWIDPTTGTQIRELQTGCGYTMFALSSYKGEIIYRDNVSLLLLLDHLLLLYQLAGCRFSVLSFELLDRHTWQFCYWRNL